MSPLKAEVAGTCSDSLPGIFAKILIFNWNRREIGREIDREKKWVINSSYSESLTFSYTGKILSKEILKIHLLI